ncbi:AfsR/SARP family transcriptional regulator [Actinoplanes flavus]|uniref:Tetratricopeptide repeat protein n=1 Tax=Actinoplanes flavus TaxID=2820290 RepID=A0ABS3UN05_9ACTN|nr:BTAD domain-containing putative transcriptional regulator [Actinoplanes flavus]MBO3740155.1 tetratricopeptide repeat protein [Actinoplanes flavus]
MSVECRVFGDIAVTSDGRQIDIGHARQKVVLAVFLLQPGQVIGVDTLIDHVWPERLPQRARASLYSYVSRLNAALTGTGVEIARRSGGYLLDIDPARIDLHRFRDAVARAREAARAGDPERALALLQAALDLCRGRPFGAVETTRLAALRTSLENERATAELDRNDLALALGGHAALLGELATAAAARPLDERLTGQLMLALYRSGRQAEAQNLYREIRQRLVDELGADPGRPLQDLYLRMVGADPALDPRPAEEEKAAARLDLVVYRTPGNRLNRPAELVGRHEPVAEVNAALDDGRPVLLHGLAGMGKTAIAATVADERLRAGGRPYVWLRVGEADEETVFEALLRRLGGGTEAALTGDARLLALQNLMDRAGIGLLVLDDVWHGPALFQVLRAVPDRIPVLVTARAKFPLDRQVEIVGLSGDEAVRLLALHWGTAPGAWSRGAADLCRLLGHHPYAVEIAGRHLRQYGLDAADLAGQIMDAPHDLAMPAGLAPSGRESVRLLLDRSYAALADPDGRLVFQTFGALDYAGASAPLLAELTGLDEKRVLVALRLLADLSLARPRDGTVFHEVHDLTFSYCRALTGADGRIAGAVRRFAEAHGGDLDLIGLDLDNLLAVAESARYADPDACTGIVAAIATGGYLDDRGHPPRLVRLLDEVIQRTGDDRLLHQLLGKRGNAYLHQGRLREAAEAYQRALDLAPDANRRAILLAVLGKTFAEMGQHERAENTLRLAYQTADAHDDEAARLRILEQHSIAAFRWKDFRLVRELTRAGVEASRRLGARAAEAIFLNNLGTAELELGLIAAFDRHGEAQRIARELNDLDILALAQHNLGLDWQAAEDAERAAHHLREALALYERLGYAQEENKVRSLMERFGHRITDPEKERGS